jgi:tyrosinase
MNTFAQQSLADHVQSQPDYTSFARALENIPGFAEPNIHGSGHFGVGGVLGTIGNQNESPGGTFFLSALLIFSFPLSMFSLC